MSKPATPSEWASRPISSMSPEPEDRHPLPVRIDRLEFRALERAKRIVVPLELGREVARLALVILRINDEVMGAGFPPFGMRRNSDKQHRYEKQQDGARSNPPLGSPLLAGPYILKQGKFFGEPGDQR